MTERTMVDVVEDWQHGFFVILGCAFAGFLTMYGVASIQDSLSPVLGMVAFFGGAVVVFLLYSFVRYGR